MFRFDLRHWAIIGIAIGSFAAWSQAPATPADPLPGSALPTPSSLERRFDQAVELIAEHFYDKELAKKRLPKELIDSYRERAIASEDLEEFARILNQMLAELKTSHCSYWPNTTREYYELRAIFGRFGLGGDDKKLRIPWIGVLTTRIDDQWYVSAVLRGIDKTDPSPFMVGDRVVSVEGEPFDPIVILLPHAGKEVRVRIERSRGKFEEVRQRVELVHPVAPYVEDMIAGAKVIEHQSLKIGYSRIWWMGRPETYAAAFHTLFQFRSCDAVVVDLRDGWGGQPDDYYALFDRQSAFCVFPGPAAVLINSGTRSAKEVVAFEFKKNQRGLLVGAETHGAVMPSRGFPVGKDGLLILAVSKMPQQEYAKLEGDGVDPDIAVPFSLPYSENRDPVLEAALQEIARRMPRAADAGQDPGHRLLVRSP